MSPELYGKLSETFPEAPALAPFFLCNRGVKFSVNNEQHRKLFAQIVHARPAWHDFYRYVVEGDFAPTLMKMFDCPVGQYFGRFEFSWLPCSNGDVPPHTDTRVKYLALVIPFPLPGEWDQAWGGSTDMLRPRYRQLRDVTGGDEVHHSHDEFEVITSCPYTSNVANVLVKTANSWHGVRCHGPAGGPWRKSITLNLCKVPTS